MLYVIETEGTVTVTDEFKVAREAELAGGKVIGRHDLKSFADAEALAELANSADDGNEYLAVDRGRSTWPRYDICKLPKVGDVVSYGFNGDYYPCGTVVSVGSGSRKTVVTSEGMKFNRKKLSASWIQPGGGWCLVQGYHNERNPHF